MTIESIANHLWQSTVVAAAAALLGLVLRRNRASVRYGVWLTASLKFLVPFALLTAIGRQFEWRSIRPIAQPAATVVLGTLGQPFSQVGTSLALAVAPAADISVARLVETGLLALWAIGFAAVLLAWSRKWRRVAATVRDASPIESGRAIEILRRLERDAGLRRPIALRSTTTSMEPGVFGLFRPVLLWPRHLNDRLTVEQIEAILAHEVCHVRRHDNLAAALHMFIEATFWFHPVVWWIGARMVDERERACDEGVVGLGSAPQSYAESIIKTCQFTVESPLACIAGVTGSNLKKRIEQIMSHSPIPTLNTWRRILLASGGIIAIAVPIAAGALRPHQVPPATSDESPTFEVASVKPNKSGDNRIMLGGPPGRFNASNVPLRELIRIAYGLQNFQIVGGPDWIASDRFDIVTKAEEGAAPEGGPFGAGAAGPSRVQLMMRALLADRFKLAVHTENRELPMYALVAAKSDGKLGPQLIPAAVDCAAMFAARGRGPGAPGGPGGPGSPGIPGGAGRGPFGPPAPGERLACGMRIGPGNIAAGGVNMAQLATTLSMWVNRIVIDKTSLGGAYDIDLHWTPDQMPQGFGGPPPGAPALPPIDPNGPSIFTAVQEQLGLKLESQKGPVEVLVIDHVEQPTPD